MLINDPVYLYFLQFPGSSISNRILFFIADRRERNIVVIKKRMKLFFWYYTIERRWLRWTTSASRALRRSYDLAKRRSNRIEAGSFSKANNSTEEKPNAWCSGLCYFLLTTLFLLNIKGYILSPLKNVFLLRNWKFKKNGFISEISQANTSQWSKEKRPKIFWVL